MAMQGGVAPAVCDAGPGLAAPAERVAGPAARATVKPRRTGTLMRVMAPPVASLHDHRRRAAELALIVHPFPNLWRPAMRTRTLLALLVVTWFCRPRLPALAIRDWTALRAQLWQRARSRTRGSRPHRPDQWRVHRAGHNEFDRQPAGFLPDRRCHRADERVGDPVRGLAAARQVERKVCRRGQRWLGGHHLVPDNVGAAPPRLRDGVDEHRPSGGSGLRRGEVRGRQAGAARGFRTSLAP